MGLNDAVDSRTQVIVVIAIAELSAMSLWFSATAAAPELAAEWGLTPSETAWLTIAVQLGFVVGALGSSVLTLSDVVLPRHLFAASATVGAATTALIALAVSSALLAIALRFVTGVALAGVYPPGMKLLAGWFRDARGFALGVLIGALTIGSSLPHLLRAIGGVGRPRLVLYGSAGLALVEAGLVLLARPGPYVAESAPFQPRVLGRILRDRGTMLANGGYFGHMWELYAIWTWIPAYLVASLSTNGAGGSAALASLLTFGTIAIGGPAAVVAGTAADRLGRTTITTAVTGTTAIARTRTIPVTAPVVPVTAVPELTAHAVVTIGADVTGPASRDRDSRTEDPRT
jgi:MFS family permease